jgi:hypothetical protein
MGCHIKSAGEKSKKTAFDPFILKALRLSQFSVE